MPGVLWGPWDWLMDRVCAWPPHAGGLQSASAPQTPANCTAGRLPPSEPVQNQAQARTPHCLPPGPSFGVSGPPLPWFPPTCSCPATRPPPAPSAGNLLLGLPLPQGWPRMAAPPKGTSVSDEGSLVRPSPTWLAASYLLSSSPPFLNLHSLQHPRPPPSRSEFSFHNAWHPLL